MSTPSVESTSLLRRMTRGDLDEVMRNETRAYAFPWTRGNFEDCLRSGYHCLVLQQPAGLVGHGVISIAAAEGHILNVCVRRESQGLGLGRQLLLRMLDCARDNGADVIFLEVRASNRVARRLYESVGFNGVGTRPGYYPAYTGREDAEVLALQF